MNDIKVSVIVPIYNVKIEFLQKCIESIVNQTLKNIEIILVIDGTKNIEEKLRYKEICKVCNDFEKQDNRIKTIQLNKNLGVSVARNTGRKIANGEFVSFVDSDDIIELTMIEKLYRNAKMNQSDIAMCGFFIDKRKKQYRNFFFRNEKVIEKQQDKDAIELQILCKKLAEVKVKTGIGSSCGKLYNRIFLDRKNLCFKEGLQRMQDNEFNFYAFENASKITYINELLYHYRYNKESASRKSDSDIVKKYEAFFVEVKKFIKHYNKDERFEMALKVKIFCALHSYLKKYILINTNKEKIKTFVNIMNKEIYKDAIDKVDSRYLILSQKIFLIFIKIFRHVKI